MMKLENLITENADGILLSSYEIPEGAEFSGGFFMPRFCCSN